MVSLLDFINSISYTDNIQDVNARTVGGSVDLLALGGRLTPLALGGRLTPPLGGRLTPLACTHTYNCKHFTTFINV